MKSILLALLLVGCATTQEATVETSHRQKDFDPEIMVIASDTVSFKFQYSPRGEGDPRGRIAIKEIVTTLGQALECPETTSYDVGVIPITPRRLEVYGMVYCETAVKAPASNPSWL